MDILRVKKAQLPAPPITSPKKKENHYKRKITSAVTVADSDCDNLPTAGSSTGTGTLAQATRGGRGGQNQGTGQSPSTPKVGI
jgi:hypothetical protein